MRLFLESFRLDWKKVLFRKKILVFILISVSIIFLAELGSRCFQETEEGINISRIMAEEVFSLINNYDAYNGYGVASVFAPPPVAQFFAFVSSTSEMSSNINALSRLKLSYSAKGILAFNSSTFIAPTFSNIILFFFTIVCLRYGYSAFKEKKFTKFLAVAGAKPNVYFPVFLAKVSNMTLYLLYFHLIVLLPVLLKGFILTGEHYSAYAQSFLNSWLLLLFFLSSGACVAIVSPMKYCTVALIIIYGVFLFGIPILLGLLIKIPETNIPPNEKIEYAQRNLIKEFEKHAKDKLGPFKESKRPLFALEAEIYFKEKYPEIEAIEAKIRDEILSGMRLQQTVSLFFPASFYSSALHELSGRGYNSYERYYRHIQVLKKGFLRFWTDRVYYTDHRVVVPYIPGNIDVFYGKSSLPPHYWLGFIFQVLLCSGIIGFSNYRLRKTIFPDAPEERDYDDVKFSVNVYHQYGVYACEKGDLKEQVVNVLSGHGGILEDKFRFNHWRFNDLKDVSFIYMPGPECFPADLKIKDLIAFLTRALEITGDQLPELHQELREYLVKAEAERIQAFVKKQEKLKKLKKKKRMKKPPKPVKDVFDLPLKSFPLPEQVVIVLKIFSKSLASIYCFDEFLKTAGGDYDTEVIHIAEEFKKKSSTIFELNSMVFPNPLLGNAKPFLYTLNKDNKYILRSSFKQ